MHDISAYKDIFYVPTRIIRITKLNQRGHNDMYNVHQLWLIHDL